MKTIKPQRLGVLCKTFDSGEASCFAVSVLVFFPFAPPAAPLPEVELWKLVAAELGSEVVDLGMPKPRGEVLVTGAAFPSGGPRPACAPRLAIGSIDKTLQVQGDRFWRDGVATSAELFTEMPLGYERAFGGKGYALNPLGKGIAPVGGLHPLPNIEDPARLVGSPADRPPPAGFGPYDLTWPQRSTKAGTYDAAWLKERFPGFARDLDPGIFNAAPEDQQISGYFQGDEAFTLEHLHPDEARIEGELPGVRARAFVTQRTGAGEVFREIETRLDTIRLFPRAARGLLIFHGMLEIAEDDGADVIHLVLGCEDLGAPKSVEHYREVLARRLDRKRGHLLALQDGELMPAPKAGAAPRDGAAERAIFATEGLLRKNLRRKIELEREGMKRRAQELGLDPDQVPLPPLPPDEPSDPDDLSVIVERAMVEADLANEAAEAQQASRAPQAPPAGGGGPPKFSAEQELEKLRSASAQAKEQGIPALEIDAALADPALEARFRAMEQQMRDAYRQLAHQLPAAAELEAARAAALCREVVEGHRAGQSFAGRDLTGVNLAGLDLARADFHGAMMEGVDLGGADLHGADLTGAVLARANLARANLFTAKLADANLGSAKLTGADLGGADLTGAVLHKADLAGASLVDAQMARADLSEAILAGADFTRVKAPGASFLKTDLSGAKLGGADLSKGNFLESRMTGVDFTGAKLVSAVLLAVQGDRAVFRDADLGNLRVVQGSSLEGADFRGARLDGANLRGTRLARSDFDGARLPGADLSECDLRGASFVRASALRARFVRAELTGADMRSINLMEGSLAKATLHGANLRRANLFRVDLARARTDEATNLEDANVKRARVVPPRRGPDAP